ncbi:hypothetical protein BU26DRAFT_166682 [Trematosphaeria pertusa]|uniref:Uncharacterized protein n=1 Tax=Trematosphaeria pertusa TaxID=390896 RepID=A0A6A6HW37_9PLEO|nr:uncharacterized protein BU26DRAFT_166682 [Trematosphaeria pertusa]KAF2242129.1 hypothetical protein BU26DRAFT_166682 [Trematosphaeria pertusa]
MEDPYDRTNLAKNTGAHRTPRLSDAYSFLQSRGTRGGPDSEAASQASKFLDRYLANGRLYEERTAQLSHLERLRRLEGVLREFANSKGNKRSGVAATVKQISNHLKSITQTETPFLAVFHQFQYNVCDFIATVTGEGKVDYTRAFSKLRDAAAHRQQQWEALYNTIEKLRSEITRKQQIITCLGYRHVLEMLSDKDSVLAQFTFSGDPPSSATAIWKVTWQLAGKGALRHGYGICSAGYSRNDWHEPDGSRCLFTKKASSLITPA